MPQRYAITHRNRYMVDKADFVVSYVLHGWGGAAQTLEYAQQKRKSIVLYKKLDTIFCDIKIKAKSTLDFLCKLMHNIFI